jgi:uncharacterized protein
MSDGASAQGRIEVLDTDVCLELLASQPVGRVAFCQEGRVHVATVNHAVDGWSVAFRTSYGPKLIAASSESEVIYQADDYDPRTRTGWSVVVRGTAESVQDDEVTHRLEALNLDTWAEGLQRDNWVRIHIGEVTGLHITRGT